MIPSRPATISLPAAVQRRIDAAVFDLLQADQPFDFTMPAGEQALLLATSLSWRIFKNPVSVFVGGVTAVLLELAEPRVRTGLWEYSSFRIEPVKRMQRTGLAAMITVYGPRRAAEEMIARVVKIHERISGTAPDGRSFRASDPDLLTWVQATASFGFIEAYARYAGILSGADRDALYREALPAAQLYGATDAPACDRDRAALFAGTELEPSPVISEFLTILRQAPVFPWPLQGVQQLLIRAAVALLPENIRGRLRLVDDGLRHWEEPLVRALASTADRLVIGTNPAVQSCRRLGLASDFLYRPHFDELP